MKKEKKNSTKSQALTLMAIQFAGYLICGFLGGYFLVCCEVEKLSWGFILLFVALISLFALMLFISIIAHEAGHMVFGLLSGYEFSSFRIGSIILVKKGGKLCLKRFHIPGTGGQCLMKPPGYSEDMPVTAYNLGGCIFNFIVTAFALIIMIISGPGTLLFTLSAMLAALNFSLGLSNFLPLNAGVTTDGYNLRAMQKDPREKYAMWLQLYFMSFLSEGGDPALLSEKVVTIPSDIDYSSSLQATGAPLLRLAYLEAKGQYEEALEQAEEILQKGNLVPVQKYDIETERTLLTAVTGKDCDTVMSLYTAEVENYSIMMRKQGINVQALLTALSFLFRDEQSESERPKGILPLEKQLAEFERVAKRYPYEGEAAVYRRMLEVLMK